jgi:SAM-dependent methyltransferase
LEVIEHLKDPQSLLQECRRILRPGGIMLIGTGNTDSWSMAYMGANWEYLSIDNHGGHVSFYNPVSMRVLAARTGFSVVRIRTRGVRFYDVKDVSKPVYRVAKIAGELLNIAAKGLNKGHDMIACLR